MALFDVPMRNNSRASDSAIAKKSNTKAKKATTTVKGGSGILNQISNIKAMVETHLGKYREESICIQDEETLHNYLDKCIENGIISVDTETTGLDPLQDELVGICIYTPNEKTAYIPVNHKSYITQERIPNQLDVDILHREFQRVADANLESVMFNGGFDIRFLRSGINVDFPCTWDTSLASRLLNENEPAKNLKMLHRKYCLDNKEDAFRFDDLFKGITFDYIPINVGFLYAAHDALITYELYQYQKPFLTDTEECRSRGLQDVARVFHEIEMPILRVVIDMEDTGVAFDFDYNSQLHDVYHKRLDESLARFHELCNMYADEIESYRAKNPDCKLDTPINVASPSQLQILLYDIIGLKNKDKKNPRGTGADILEKMDNPLCKAILEYRTLEKLVGTYIDKLPECANPKDGRIHCKFNQYGADTGRFSSSDPNLQNIPSHNTDIRKMFKATDGYALMSSDFSQQEPKALAALCRQDGDNQMYNTFMEGKDLYSEIASKAFNVPYDECKEFRPDGTTNKAGKERRSQAKSILLGVLYGRGEASIAEQLGCTEQKAKDIKESVFRGFPAIKKFETDSLAMAKELGFVTTVCGRKRRLPDLQLDEFEFKYEDGYLPIEDSDPYMMFSDCMNEPIVSEVPLDRQQYYLRKLKTCRFTEKRKVFEEANEEGIWIVDNGMKIADATRQCVNSRIQGSAADLTKVAMIKLWENERLRELGFRMLIPVHDEIIAECPKENLDECSELLADTMSKAAEAILEMPIKCDVARSYCWYGEEI